MNGNCGHGCKYFSSGIDKTKTCTNGNQSALDFWWKVHKNVLVTECAPIECYAPYDIEVSLSKAIELTNKLLKKM